MLELQVEAFIPQQSCFNNIKRMMMITALSTAVQVLLVTQKSKNAE